MSCLVLDVDSSEYQDLARRQQTSNVQLLVGECKGSRSETHNVNNAKYRLSLANSRTIALADACKGILRG